MSVERIRVPYEMLLRWDEKTGVFRGAQIQWIERVIVEGEVLSEKVLDAEPVSIQGEGGFPLADVMNLATRDALAAHATMTQERDTATFAAAQLMQERDAALAELARRSAGPSDAPSKAPDEPALAADVAVVDAPQA